MHFLIEVGENMAIEISDVSYTYMPHTPYEKTALSNINISFPENAFIAIAGHTGSGKSTLMQHISGLLKPTKGKVLVDGIDWQDKKQRQLLRGRVGMVFQYPEQQLFEETVYNDIAFGPRNFAIPENEIAERVQMAMRFVGLDYATYKDEAPFLLSGGQMRKVAIAGIVALRPKYLVLDEPTAGLDPQAKRELLGNIKKWHEKEKCTVIIVSHNMDDIISLAERVIILGKGEVLADGVPEEILLNKVILEKAGLKMPQLSQILLKLSEAGIPINIHQTDVQKAAMDIANAWKKVGKND